MYWLIRRKASVRGLGGSIHPRGTSTRPLTSNLKYKGVFHLQED